MFKNIRLYVAFALLVAAVAALAQDTKSFSKRMNEIKRSGDFVYAESSAPNEADAKAACDALLKIEITKFIASESDSQSEERIVKDISEYNREYLVQPRGDMVRVFGYVAKAGVLKAKKSKKEKKADKAEAQPEKPAEQTAEQPTEDQPAEQNAGETSAETPAQPAGGQPAEQTAPDNPAAGLQTGDLSLARWQTDMLENIVKQPNMAEAKKLLNRYKSQNRIKRLGERSTPNPRRADSFFLVFGDGQAPVALLAPSATSEHFDMMTGTTVNFDNISSSQYIWFQISK